MSHEILAKPNPESLIRSIKGLNSKNCLYVGEFNGGSYYGTKGFRIRLSNYIFVEYMALANFLR